MSFDLVLFFFPAGRQCGEGCRDVEGEGKSGADGD